MIIKAFSATPFLRELVLYINELTAGVAIEKDEITKLLAVLIDQISRSSHYEMTLLLPNDRRLMLIFEALMANPQLNTNLAGWGI